MALLESTPYASVAMAREFVRSRASEQREIETTGTAELHGWTLIDWKIKSPDTGNVVAVKLYRDKEDVLRCSHCSGVVSEPV